MNDAIEALRLSAHVQLGGNESDILQHDDERERKDSDNQGRNRNGVSPFPVHRSRSTNDTAVSGFFGKQGIAEAPDKIDS